MKKLLMTALFLLLQPFAFGAGTDVSVKGMTCSNCEHIVEGKFQSQPEIASAKADYKKGTLHLEFKDGKKLSKEQISTLVSEAGYTAK